MEILEQPDYLFTNECEDCHNRAAYVDWENWCDEFVVSRFICNECGHEWDDIWVWKDDKTWKLGP